MIFEIGLAEFSPPPVRSWREQLRSGLQSVKDFRGGEARIPRLTTESTSSNFRRLKFDQPPLVLSVGRLISKKGFDILIEACAIFARSRLDFRCEIIGEGPLQQELQTRIDQHQLADRVTLSGPKPQREVATPAGGGKRSSPCLAGWIAMARWIICRR